MKALRLAFAAACGLLAACAAEKTSEAIEAPAAHLADASAGRPVVVGTVVDARSGAPVAGASVQGPDGSAAETGPDGRFRLKGMARGTAGPLTATHGERRGAVVLRPLAGGRLEVVVYVR